MADLTTEKATSQMLENSRIMLERQVWYSASFVYLLFHKLNILTKIL